MNNITYVPAIIPVSGGQAWGAPAVAQNTAMPQSTQGSQALSGVTLLEAAVRELISQQHQAAAAVTVQSQVPMMPAPAVVYSDPTPPLVPEPQVAEQSLANRALQGFAAATGKAVQFVGEAAGAGVNNAKRVGKEVWAGVISPKLAHVTQVPSKFNPSPAAGNKDCGPTSVVIALKMLGSKIPGAKKSASPQELINRVRKLADSPNNRDSTSNLQLAKALNKAGASTSETTSMRAIKQAVRDGKPVILNGNPRHSGAYGHKFDAEKMTPYNGAHWIVVTGMDDASGKYIINDPLSKVGPVKVSAKELDAYRGGSLGIIVSK